MGRKAREISEIKEKQASRFANARKWLNMTQREFAEQINRSEPQVRLYEKCKNDIPIEIIDIVFELLNKNGIQVEKDYLMGIKELNGIENIEKQTQAVKQAKASKHKRKELQQNDKEIIIKLSKADILSEFTTQELLAEINRRIEAS